LGGYDRQLRINDLKSLPSLFGWWEGGLGVFEIFEIFEKDEKN
jgi:hypothetical protein